MTRPTRPVGAARSVRASALGRAACAGALAMLLGGTAEARNDQIVLVADGTVLDKLEVQRQTVDEVRFRGPGGVQTRPSREVLRIVHGNPPAAFGRGEAALAAGNYSVAVESFRAAESEGGGDWVKPYATYHRAEALRRWGGALQDAGKLTEATETYERFLSESADHFLVPAVRYGLGDTFLRRGMVAEAQAQFAEVAQRKYGDYWEMWGKLGKGQAAFAEKKFGDARQEFETTLAQARTRAGFGEIAARCQVMLGETLMANRDFDRAITFYEELAARGEGQGAQSVGSAYVNLAKAYVQRGKAEDKRRALKTYIAVTIYFAGAPEAYAEALYEAALLFEQDGNKPQAEALRRELKARCPESVWAKKAK